MINTHFDLSDSEFAGQFATLLLPPSLFNHEAHLRLAFILIKKLGTEGACEEMCTQILAFDRKHGDGQKYHRTITVAAVKTMDHFMRRASTATFRELLEKFPRLHNNFRELLSAHYSKQVLGHPLARKEFLEPDLQPYDI